MASTGQADATVAAGDSSSCSLKQDGTVWCWGSARAGLGDSDATVISGSPVQVEGLTGVLDVVVGYQFACALNADRQVSCWGRGNHGQLGDGQVADSPTPVTVSLIGSVKQVAAGPNHVCAVQDGGAVACWGYNDRGQLGDGTTDDRAVPVQVSSISDAVAIAAGDEHSCAVLATGSVRCWGDNQVGQLGNGFDGNGELTPVEVSGNLGDAVAVSAGEEHSCALRAAGTVSCWGDNWRGELGDGTQIDRLTPVPVTGLTGARQITSGFDSNCALTDTGTWCWGNNDSGQLALGADVTQSEVPVKLSTLNDATRVAAGGRHVCAASPNEPNAAHEVIRCWGDGALGQLGNGKLGSSKTPLPVTGLSGVESIALGAAHSCSLIENGRVECWGSNREGQLGSGSAPVGASPAEVSGLNDASQITSGAAFSCALRPGDTGPDRKISCWGSDSSGQFGVGRLPAGKSITPIDVDTSGMLGTVDLRVTNVSAGNTFVCALTRSGNADYGRTWCWGSAGFGETGSELNPPWSIPDPVEVHRDGILMRVDQSAGPTLTTGQHHACVIAGAAGNVWCWGNNYYGQVGDGTNENTRARPRQVTGLTGAVSVYAGGAHTCALLETGKVKCWGWGAYGQLGTGSSTSHNSPVEVLIDDVRSLSLNENQTCAVTTDDLVSCWGWRFDPGFPVAGNPNPNPAWAPSALAGVTDVASVSLGNNHACVATNGGKVSCWADDSQQFRYSYDAPHGDGAMPTGHYPIQTVPSSVIGFEPDPVPVPEPGPAPPRRPAHPKIELRDGTVRLRGLGLRKTNSRPCVRQVRATVTGRVTFRHKRRKVSRTLKTGKRLNLAPAGANCAVKGAIRLRGRLATAKKVTVKFTGNRLKPARRTVRARTTVGIRNGRLVIDRLRLGSTRGDLCPTAATVTVNGSRGAARKVRINRKSRVALAPAAGCQVSIGFRLPAKLRRAGKVVVRVKGPGLKAVGRSLSVG